MTAQILAIIGSLLTIVIGYWKYSKNKQRVRQEKKEKAGNETHTANNQGDSSGITSGFDSLRRLRGK